MLPFYDVRSMENIQISDMNFSRIGFYSMNSFKNDELLMNLYEQLVGDDIGSSDAGISNICDEF